MSTGGAAGGRGPASGVATGLAALVAALLVVLLVWPDGDLMNRAVVRVYVFFLGLGMPQSVRPEVYAVLLNVAVFVLLGWLGVALAGWPAVRTAIGLTVLSAAIELFQALPGMGRDPSLLDVACNALGAGIGVTVASVVRRRRAGVAGATLDQPGVDQGGHERRDVGGDHLGR
ncbi:MAG: VanZ family protein [Ornithinibacter sp.]